MLDAAATTESTVDLCIVTGDCVAALPLEGDHSFRDGQDGDNGYRLLRKMVEDRLPLSTVRAIPGNHDSREKLSAVFPESARGGGSATPAPEQVHCFAEKLGGWLVIGCDSQTGNALDPAVEGNLAESQLAWVRTMLSTHTSSPTIIFLHHPPTRGTPQSFTESGAVAFEELLKDAKGQIKAVVAGHVHADLTIKTVGGVPIYATPSCVFQSRVSNDGLFLGAPNDIERGPGYRVLDLEPDGTLITRVVRPPMPAGYAKFDDLLEGPRMARRAWPRGARALL